MNVWHLGMLFVYLLHRLNLHKYLFCLCNHKAMANLDPALFLYSQGNGTRTSLYQRSIYFWSRLHLKGPHVLTLHSEVLTIHSKHLKALFYINMCIYIYTYIYVYMGNDLNYVFVMDLYRHIHYLYHWKHEETAIIRNWKSTSKKNTYHPLIIVADAQTMGLTLLTRV